MSARDELINALEESDQTGCGCCSNAREMSTGPEEWEVDYIPRIEALADDLLAAGFGKLEDAWDEGAYAYETRRARDESLPLTNPYKNLGNPENSGNPSRKLGQN